MSTKILLLIDSLSSGGAQRQMTYLAVGLQQQGFDVRLVAFSDAAKNFYQNYLSENGVVIINNTRGLSRIRRVVEIVKYVIKFRPRAVIGYIDGVTMAACIARMFVKFRLIVSERNTTQELVSRERLKFRLYRRADLIVPNSFSQKEFIDRNYPELASKVKVITNAIDTSRFKPDVTETPREIVEIVTTARVQPQKNVLIFLESVKLLKDAGARAHFKWYGFQGDPYFTEVMARRRELGVEDMVVFMPPVSKIENIYREADIFCLPSIYEGFPNVVCEAMACGLPIVCGNVCDNPTIVTSGINGFLFNPLDPYDIASKISQILSLSNTQIKEMSIANRSKIIDMCSFDTFIKRYLEII